MPWRGTVPISAAAPNPRAGRERPTRAEALVRLHDITLTGALDEVEFSLTAALEGGPHTMAVDMSRVRHLSSTTVAAPLWIKRCARARGIECVLRNSPPGIVDRLQRAGLLGVLVVEPLPADGPKPGSALTPSATAAMTSAHQPGAHTSPAAGPLDGGLPAGTQMDLVCGPKAGATARAIARGWGTTQDVSDAAVTRLEALVHTAVRHGLRFGPRAVAIRMG